ncbi:MAG: SUMF1/EgtB/PvdO family nonheme iron enzyme [Hyphomonadaceae bacterium]|nr:SUMF1/EgtB/PvdO family nonheme iron enzyme [Hyphomonadaceae bacterium]
MRWVVRILAALVVLAAGMGNAQQPGPAKLALVVGVSDYGRERAAQEAAGFIVPPALANAVQDAELVATALAAKGFTVTRVTNPDKRALLSALNTFAASLSRAGPDAVGVFYFAGHGAQGRPALERDIDNYLIPLGADLATEVDLESEALALSRVSAALRPAAQGAVVLILDACRDFALPAASRSGFVTRGLAEARAAPGTIIAYATSPGATALDSLPGQSNGPYASALAAEIFAAQGARLEDVFIATRNRVLTATRNTQTPWENGSLRRAVTLGVAPVSMTTAIDRSELPPPPAPKTRPGEMFKECDVCPEMVVVPAGRFLMGSPASEEARSRNESPQREVIIPRPFAVGRFEVTFAMWDSCVSHDGCAPPEEGPWSPPDHGWGRGNRPVINVSWQDAKRYVRFLNGRVGGRAYRLMTEAEWEYAARAGTTTAFSFGPVIAPTEALYGHRKSYAAGPFGERNPDKTVLTGSFAPNAFKLHDMHGNVWEWVEDCYANTYAYAPNDGSSFAPLSCSERVARGGSWNTYPNWLRSASRAGDKPWVRSHDVGFRVARTL